MSELKKRTGKAEMKKGQTENRTGAYVHGGIPLHSTPLAALPHCPYIIHGGRPPAIQGGVPREPCCWDGDPCWAGGRGGPCVGRRPPYGLHRPGQLRAERDEGRQVGVRAYAPPELKREQPVTKTRPCVYECVPLSARMHSSCAAPSLFSPPLLSGQRMQSNQAGHRFCVIPHPARKANEEKG